MLTQKNQNTLVRTLWVMVFQVLVSFSLAGDFSPALVFEGRSFEPLIGEKSASESGFNYYLVERGEMSQFWSNEGSVWSPRVTGESNLQGIWGIDGQDVFVAHGGHNGVCRYHNGSWLVDVFSGSGSDIYDVWGFDRNDVFAVGHNASDASTQLFHYDGSSWTEVANQAGLVAGSGLWGPSPEHLFMIGSGGAIGLFDGANITPMVSGVVADLNGIWGTSTDNVYAVGNNEVVIHFDGNSWQPVNIPPFEANYYGVWGTGPNDVYVVGGLIVLHFDGSTWSQVTGMPGGSFFRDVYGSSSSDILMVGDNGLILHFDGENWVDQSVDAGQLTGVWGGYKSEGDQYWSSRFNDQGQGGFGFDGSVRALEPWGSGMVVAGQFQLAGTDTIRRLAYWDGETLAPLYQSEGPNQSVYDLIVYDGELVAGGAFTSIDGTAINGVAAWNGSQWHALGAGVGTPTSWGVIRFTIWDGKLVAVGEPGCTGSWDGSEWTMMGGFEGFLFGAIEYQGFLLAGGRTTVPGNGVLIYGDGAWGVSPWTEVGEDTIVDFQIFQNSLLVGGEFTSFGELTDTGGLVQLNNFGWSVYEGGVAGAVYQIQNFQDGILVGGYFNGLMNGLPAKNIAYFDGQDWQTLGSGVNGWHWASLLDGNRLTVGGSFSSAGNHPAYQVATWEAIDLAIPDAPAGDPAQSGQDHTISINLEGDPGSYPVNLHYRLRDDDPYQVAVMNLNAAKNGVYEATVPADFFGDLGFQFYVSSGGTDDPVFYPSSAPAEPSFTSVVMVNESLDLPLADQYVMMGIPFIPNQSISNILIDAFGPYDPTVWRFGRWQPLTLSYGEFPNIPAHAPGRGYWLVHKNSTELQASGVTTSTVGSVVVVLEPGWNQIATPYNFSIPWSSVTRGANIENRLVARAGGGYVDVEQMNSWQGYWVRNTGLNATTLTIPPTVMNSPFMKEKVDPVLDTALWTITLDVEYEDRFDRQNIAAVAQEASAGIDTLDYFEPPALPGDVSLFFELSENQITHALSRDIRAPFTEGVAWDLVLRHQGGGLVALDITGGAEIPGDCDVVLLTQDQNIDLRQTNQASVLVGSGGETRLRLVVGEPEFIQEQERSLPRPFALRTAYPNPFNPQTTLGFTLPRSSHVKLCVFDVRGRLIRNLVDDTFEAGLHEVFWTGQDDRGRGVAAGVYFSRMQTEQFQQTKKMTLVR